jgi:hypothetical protein
MASGSSSSIIFVSALIQVLAAVEHHAVLTRRTGFYVEGVAA